MSEEKELDQGEQLRRPWSMSGEERLGPAGRGRKCCAALEAYCTGCSSSWTRRQDRAGVRGQGHRPGGGRRRLPGLLSGDGAEARGPDHLGEPGQRPSCWR